MVANVYKIKRSSGNALDMNTLIQGCGTCVLVVVTISPESSDWKLRYIIFLPQSANPVYVALKVKDLYLRRFLYQQQRFDITIENRGTLFKNNLHSYFLDDIVQFIVTKSQRTVLVARSPL